MKVRTVHDLIKKSVEALREGQVPLAPTLDKDGKLVLTKPITPDDIKRNPQLAQQLLTQSGVSGDVTMNPATNTPTNPTGNPNIANTVGTKASFNNVKQEGLNNLKEGFGYEGAESTPIGTQYRAMIDYDTIIKFASNPYNLYRAAAEMFLYQMKWSAVSQNIVFLLKQRGHIEDVDIKVAQQQLEELLEKDKESIVTAMVQDNMLVVLVGFSLNDDPKVYVSNELWYSIDGRLRAINIKTFKSKAESTASYKEILKTAVS